MAPTNNLLTAKQVAQRFSVTVSAVYMWARVGTLPSQKIGRCVRFAEHDVDSFAKPQGQNAPTSEVPA